MHASRTPSTAFRAPIRNVTEGPIESSTEGPICGIHMRPRHRCRHTPHTLRGPIASFTESGAHNASLATAYGW
eukprot:6993671-Pyramimonas_sp.AAC.1